MAAEERREVDVWTREGGFYARPPIWKRAKGPFKGMAEATAAVAEEYPYPFTINYRDPAEVPQEEWPITRKRKEA